MHKKVSKKEVKNKWAIAEDKAFSQGIRKAYEDVDAWRVQTYASVEEFRKCVRNR